VVLRLVDEAGSSTRDDLTPKLKQETLELVCFSITDTNYNTPFKELINHGMGLCRVWKKLLRKFFQTLHNPVLQRSGPFSLQIEPINLEKM
jgi:hypothetical protein